ncbi:hypothetical protein DFJ67_4818 [Asanoa ferruginea]|uniref:Collagen triple helix repeat protein n=1 Tax=Asanoa ferruginea TaxID=53367 RepID=A0A3D9ZN58_9ACTN|nr:hypothetical protein [Asanoa ferruginea]REF98798.1 hypothetical protein DFJ67_4818 [Asanoa ferruginea]GIF49541.1 hypothetical protein Afe04nite_40800 [Asanoa ferruginea]
MEPVTKRRVRRALGVTGVAAAVVLAFGGFAQADTEKAAGTIYACVNNRTGDVRIPNPFNGGGQRCNKGERWVVWNVQGPRGPQGERGAPGPRGPAGPAGPAGLTGVGQSVPNSGSIPANSSDTPVTANCPAGMVATGGGFLENSNFVRVLASRPNPQSGAGPFTGWTVNFANSSGQVGTGSAYVLCYTAPS